MSETDALECHWVEPLASMHETLASNPSTETGEGENKIPMVLYRISCSDCSISFHLKWFLYPMFSLTKQTKHPGSYFGECPQPQSNRDQIELSIFGKNTSQVFPSVSLQGSRRLTVSHYCWVQGNLAGCSLTGIPHHGTISLKSCEGMRPVLLLAPAVAEQLSDGDILMPLRTEILL